MNRLLRRKIIITGTGRAGTTFLVQLLTELGLETGFRPGGTDASYHEHCHAGLEHDLRDPQAPYVVKNPNLCDTLAAILDEGDVVIDHALVPIRRLEDATQSRIRVGGEGKTPGGLTGTADEAQQQRVLAERFHRLIHTLAAHQVPTTFLDFPQFAQDAAYTFRALKPLLPPTVGRAEFTAAFARTARPELIHQFNGRRDPSSGAPAREHATVRRAMSATRRRRRWAALTSMVAALGIVGWIQSGRSEEHAAELASGADPAAEFIPAALVSERESAATAAATADHASLEPSPLNRGLYLDPAPIVRVVPRTSRGPGRATPFSRTAGRGAKTPAWM